MLIALLCCNNSKSKKENEIKDKLKNVLLFLIVVVEVNKLLFSLKKYDACAVGAPYFPKSFGATFQSYFREDNKLT